MTEAEHSPDWIAAEYCAGTVTAWLMQGSRVIERQVSAPAKAQAQDDLAAVLSGMPDLPAVISGSGLCSAAVVPAKPAELPLHPAGPALGSQAHLLPGLRQDAPAALMQGGETRIAGFLSLNRNWDGVLCLPGRSTHWVQVSAGEVVSFQSFLTAGLQQALAAILGGDAAEWDGAALAAALEDTMARPERLAARLAELQAGAAMGGLDRAALAGRLWGSLLGAELAAARAYWLGQNLALIADKPLAALYQAALLAQGLPVTLAAPEAMALAGLAAARRRLPG